MLAIITSGFSAGFTTVIVSAAVVDGTTILLYDDVTKKRLGQATASNGIAAINPNDPLYAGQRIIAYVGEFGKDTYGAVVVTQWAGEKTGWKVPAAVNGFPYEVYLNDGGQILPELYDPEECRNYSQDRDHVSGLLAMPLTYDIRLNATQVGTVQVLVENVRNAIGGYRIKFDNDVAGNTTSKTYNANGTYQVKVWGANQTEAEAVVKTYPLTMPVATAIFYEDIRSLRWGYTDIDNTSQPGKRPITVFAYTKSGVIPQCTVVGHPDGWRDMTPTNSWSTDNVGWTYFPFYLAAGAHTLKVRRKSDGGNEISLDIKLFGY